MARISPRCRNDGTPVKRFGDLCDDCQVMTHCANCDVRGSEHDTNAYACDLFTPQSDYMVELEKADRRALEERHTS